MAHTDGLRGNESVGVMISYIDWMAYCPQM